MKIFLTGANGFIGSHILDKLRDAGMEVRLLLRETSDTSLIEHHLPDVEVVYGTLEDFKGLREAVDGVDYVIHCAGKTKALRNKEYFDVNTAGTRNLVEAVNHYSDSIKQFILVSSQAVNGPSTTKRPAEESNTPDPISIYGQSKLLGEQEVTMGCEIPWTILRPSAVYGPGDTDFLSAFRAVKHHVKPLFNGGKQQISLVYGPDVARAVMACLGEPKAFGEVYNIASPTPCTTGELMTTIGRQLGVWTIPLPIPAFALLLMCIVREIIAKVTCKPSILSREKYRELKAPGWVTSVKKVENALGFVADTTLKQGIADTIRWYRQNGWL
jgi:nucleoside-diphosphate-sugar epimerase